MTTTRRSLDVRTLRAVARMCEALVAPWVEGKPSPNTYKGGFDDGMAMGFRIAAKLARDKARAASSKPSRKRGVR